MKVAQSLSLVAVAVAAALAVSPAMAQQPAPGKPVTQIKDAEARLEAIKVTAIVTAIDAKNRIVTFKGPGGNEFAVVADQSVRNFAQIKVGDELVVEYIQAVALDFQKGDGIRMMSSIDDSARAKAGAKPGAAAMRKVTVVTNIWAVDQSKGTVLVRGPYGHFTEVKLKDPGLLSGVKVGDQMKISYTDAVAIGIARPK
jgi:hypothetical protein